MTDFVLSAKFTGDASELEATARSAKAVIEDVTGDTGRATEGSRAFGEATAKARESTEGLAGSIGSAGEAVEALTGAFGSNSAAAATNTTGRRAQSGAVGAATAAAGVNSTAIVANTGATAANTAATSAMTAAKTAAATLLGGVFGAAATLAAAALASLFSSSRDTENQTHRTNDAFNVQRLSLEELNQAIEDQRRALERHSESAQVSEQRALNSAEAWLSEARARRAGAVETLRQAEANLRLLDSTREVNDGSGGGSAQAAARALAVAQLDSVRALLAEIESRTIPSAEALLREARVPRVDRGIAESRDAETRSTGSLERALHNLQVQRRRNDISEEEYDRRRRARLDQRDRERAQIEAEERAEREARRRPRATSDGVSRFRTREQAIGIAGRELLRQGFNVGENAQFGGVGGGHTFAGHGRFAIDVNVPGSGVEANDPEDRARLDAVARSYQARGYRVLWDRRIYEAGGNGPGPVIPARSRTGQRIGDHRNHLHLEAPGSIVGRPTQAALAADTARDATREATAQQRANEQLDRDLETLTGRFGAAEAAAREYEETLARIATLQASGRLSPEQAEVYSARAFDAHIETITRIGQQEEEARRRFTETLSPEFQRALRVATTRPDVRNAVVDLGDVFGQRSAEALRQHGIAAARAIADVIGGGLGRGLGDGLGLLVGLKTGDFSGVGGRAGGILNLLTQHDNGAGLKRALAPLTDGLEGILGKLGTSIQGLTAAVPYVSAAIAANQAIGSLLGNDQIKNGDILNLLIGPFATALFGSAKRGSATITSLDGVTTRGNSSSRIGAATGLATSVQGALQQIADALGGTIGSFSGSIGVRKKKFVVDPSGQGRTKGSGVFKFDSQEEAAAALLRDAILDGAIVGLSAAMQQALQSNPDIDKALKEALKVDEIETLLAGLGGQLGKQFKVFETQAAERLRIGAKYGFDLVKLEEANAKERAELFDQIIGSRVGALKELIADLDFGDLFEGSLVDRRTRLIAELDKAATDAAAGIDGAAQRQAQLSRDLVALSREAFGTAGPELASDIERARTNAERVIQLENERVRAAADAAKETNSQLNEANNQLSQHTGILTDIRGSLEVIAGGGFGGGTAPIDTGRFTEFNQ